jgi:AraC family transcriptional regulator of adaptative response / DNA-3-methyladenine glycosylase II
LSQRAVPGVESVTAERYERTLRLPRGYGTVGVELGPGHPGEALVRLQLADLRDLAAAVERCREILDLDADPATIAADLSTDPVLAPLVRRAPGLRVPGGADGVEVLVRAMLGRDAPTATLLRLVERYGEQVGDRRLFPTPESLAQADLSAVGLTARRAATVRAVATAVADGSLLLDRGADRLTALAMLRAIPGIGPSITAYVARHALGDPDVFGADPALRTVIARLGADHHRWRPWRSYAAGYLRTFAGRDDASPSGTPPITRRP